ncbi:carbohydrate ABC transporter permease [Enterocloster sp. OA13]|uniref:carbohydrate ABC transporter permease n=1 Tax=Enterocloster sp. OA13 TaxID=2914161 RepID=UPI00047290CD|nr:carbohydrate ABC transporter permease [Enterocloster sp. OA13]
MYKVLSALKKAAANLFVILISFTCVFPIIWLIYSTLKTSAEFDTNVIALPVNPTLDNYKKVLTVSSMPKYMLNSVMISVITVMLILVTSFVIGYFLARYDFRFRNLIYGGFLIGMLIPIHSLMVPIYIIFSKLHINDHRFTLVIPYLAFQMPIALYLMENYIHSIPREMEEAAAIDGASFDMRLFRIVLPMAKPVMTAAGIIAFFYCWNEFSFALILTTRETLRTLPLGLALFKGSYTTNYPMLMAAMAIAIAPALVTYMLFSKNIIKGMMSGAVKG